MTFREYIETNSRSGRISEIISLTTKYYELPVSSLTTEQKLNALCFAQKISPQELDGVISKHSEVLRTVKGHVFEVVFDYIMAKNNVKCIEVGGDNDVDRSINGCSLQLKTPYVNGCEGSIISYKTHKTHGAKSELESMDYYHRVSDFADYLVGLVSYDPFNVLIIPKEKLPRVPNSFTHIQSPMYIETLNCPYLNNYHQIGIKTTLNYSSSEFSLSRNECLPNSSRAINVKSEFILRAIFIKENFRIWDMNMRGFIREKKFDSILKQHNVTSFPVNITGLERSDKCDLVLQNRNANYVRFQLKGLTWKGCKLDKGNAAIDCESQLSRGRVNDHPTQSRLYKTSDFEFLLISVDPPYSDSLSMAQYGTHDYNWHFFAIPMSRLRKHPSYPKRVFSHQMIPYNELMDYIVTDDWFSQWM